MMQRFFKLDTVIRRAPLGLRFLDLVRAVNVNDGLVVSARRFGTAGPRQLALRSPLSGIYGFRILPGLRRFEVGERPASDWCAPPTEVGEPTAEDLTALKTLRGLLEADEGPPTNANFIISVQDSLARFLPQVLLMCLPREKLVEVPLFSSPARLVPAGLGALRGELARHDIQPIQPAKWALVTAETPDKHTYVGVADARGMFTVHIPYASTPPHLATAPPPGSGATAPLTIQLSIEVHYEPAKQKFVSDLEPPDVVSIMEQGNAKIYEALDLPPNPIITDTIRFGQDLMLKTLNRSQLFVDPAS